MTGASFDVLVIGGGPAGATCAYHVARGGGRVALFEQPRARRKTCGGCLTTPAWDEIGRPKAVTATPVREAVFEMAGGGRVRLEPHGDAFLVDRDRLDAYLLERAEAAGAVVLRRRARGFHKTRQGWLVETQDGRYDAPLLVGADGCKSMVREALVGGFSPSDLAFGIGVRPAWEWLAPGLARPGSVRGVFFDRLSLGLSGRPPWHGYAYVLGGAERPLLGAWARGTGRQAAALFKSLLARGWLSAEGQAACRPLGRPSPCARSTAVLDRPSAGDDWLLVGDAAGHVNPVTGEGIRYAIRGGRLAASAILAGTPRLYHDRWQAHYGDVLRWGIRFVQVHERSSVLRRWLARARGSSPMAEWLGDMAFARGSYGRLFVTGALRGLWHVLGT